MVFGYKDQVRWRIKGGELNTEKELIIIFIGGSGCISLVISSSLEECISCLLNPWNLITTGYNSEWGWKHKLGQTNHSILFFCHANSTGMTIFWHPAHPPPNLPVSVYKEGVFFLSQGQCKQSYWYSSEHSCLPELREF